MHKCGAVYAGGLSTRFGRDKFIYEVNGVAMGLHAARVLTEVCSNDVWLQGGLPSYEELTGLSVRTGRREGSGPLGALADALEMCKGDLLFTLPCDTPFVMAKDLCLLEDSLDESDDAAIAGSRREDGSLEWHWLIAAWRIRTCETIVQSHDNGLRAMFSLKDFLRLRVVEMSAESVTNLNEQPR